MTKKQTGRSMIEMLGVLVIVGVLSIAALFGFTYAMNKHRANETIHDVMLRASNVPMIDEYYQTRPTGYGFKFPDLQDELSSMGYTMKTLKTDEFEYVYKVEAEAIPYRVCKMILRLEPTDIDEIRIGTDKAVYRRGLWDLCETHVDEATDTVLMSFYFEKACETNADCSDCQECYQGRCKANYNLVGCETEGSDVPSSCIGSDCDENGGCVGSDCTICVGKDCGDDGNCIGPDCTSCTGSDCGSNGECEGPSCVSNPPSSCIGSDCDENGGCVGSDCTICVGSDCDEDGNCVGPDCTSCTGSDCGSNGECEGPDCEGCQGEGCTLNPPGSGDDPCDKDPDSYECQTKCQDSPNPYCCRYPEAEECKCSSNRPICSSCERYTYDVKGCAIGCESACNTLNCESCVGGLCVSSCSGDEYCENGVCKKECVPGCDAGQCMKCEDGSCVSSCSGNEYCDNGVCKKGCDPVCDSSQCMKCEDGTCVSSCSGDEYCDNGVCKKGCDPACDATQCMKCEDGSCVTSCGDTEECVNGSCVAQCGPCEERIEGECQSICDGGQVCENEQCVCPVEMPNWYGEMCHLCPENFSECEGNCCSPDETCCQGACYDFTLCAGSSTGGFDYSTCSCICSSTQQICSLTDEKWCCSREEECSNAEVGACCEKLTPEDCSVCSKLELRGACYQCVSTAANGDACTNDAGQAGTCDNGTCVVGCDEETQHSCTNGTDTWCCPNGRSCGSYKGDCNSCNNTTNCFKSKDSNSCTSEHTKICQDCGYDLVLVGVIDDDYPDYRAEIYGCGGQKSCAADETWKLKSKYGQLGYGCVPNSYVACCNYLYNWEDDKIVSVTSNGFVDYAPSEAECYSEDPDIGYTAACS